MKQNKVVPMGSKVSPDPPRARRTTSAAVMDIGSPILNRMRQRLTSKSQSYFKSLGDADKWLVDVDQVVSKEVYSLFRASSSGSKDMVFSDLRRVLVELDKHISDEVQQFQNFIKQQAHYIRTGELLASGDHKNKSRSFYHGSADLFVLEAMRDAEDDDGLDTCRVDIDQFKRVMDNFQRYKIEVERSETDHDRREPQDCLTVRHNASWRMTWDGFTMVLVLYVALMQPYRIGFDVNPDDGSFMFYFEWMVDIVFIVDLVVNFRTGYIDPQTGKIVLRGAAIAKNYLQGFFIIDFVSSIPWDLVLSIFGSGGEAGSNARVLKTIRLVRLVRLGRLAKVKRAMERLSEAVSIEREHRSVLAAIAILIFFSHMLACIWAAIPRFNAPDNVALDPFSWYAEAGMVDEPALTQYTHAMYWAITTVTTVGYGDVTPTSVPETVFVSVAMIAAGAFYGYLVASISAYFMNTDAHMAEYDDKMRKLKAYMALRKYPQALGRKVKSYFSHFYQQKTEFNELMMLKQLPHDTSEEVSTFLSNHLLARHYVFSGIEARFMTQILGLLCPRRCLAGVFLEHIGGSAQEMYIVTRGCIHITNAYGDIRAEFTDDQTFMEYASVQLLKEHKFNACASSNTDMYSIKGHDFQDMLTREMFLHVLRTVRKLEAGRAVLEQSLIDGKPTRQEELKQFKRAFAKFDTAGKGEIVVECMHSALQALPAFKDVPKEELVNVITEIDEDKSGTIDFNEFHALLLHFKRKGKKTFGGFGLAARKSVSQSESGAQRKQKKAVDRAFVVAQLARIEGSVTKRLTSIHTKLERLLSHRRHSVDPVPPGMPCFAPSPPGIVQASSDDLVMPGPSGLSMRTSYKKPNLR